MIEVCQYDRKGRFHKVLLTRKQVLWLACDVEHTPVVRGYRKLFLFDRPSVQDGGTSSACKTNRPDSSVCSALTGAVLTPPKEVSEGNTASPPLTNLGRLRRWSMFSD